MTTSRPNSLASRILKVFDLDPTMSSYQIAALCDAQANYVRRVLDYHGRKLFRRRYEARKRSVDRLPVSST